MTSRERISRMLAHKKADRIGVYEHFWSDTHKAYVSQGKIKPDESFEDHFGLDLQLCWNLNLVLDQDFTPEVLEETEDTILTKDGNGAMLRRHKKHDTTPEHVGFSVKNYADWREVRGRLTDVDLKRVNFAAYREAKEIAAKTNRYFCWSGINVFEAMHPVCGHEHMLVGMAMEPEWIEDMVNVYTDLTIALQEELFAREGYPDGIFYYEDMGFKERPFMSPRMYKELIFPAHKRSIDFAHAHNLPVIMHSCGFIEPLLPGMVEAGIDCLQVIEVKAGCDLLRIYKDFGEKLALMGGIDVRELYSNDFARVEAELRKKIPVVKEGFAYCLHSDHSIPNTVNYETLKYFIETGMEMGRYD